MRYGGILSYQPFLDDLRGYVPSPEGYRKLKWWYDDLSYRATYMGYGRVWAVGVQRGFLILSVATRWHINNRLEGCQRLEAGTLEANWETHSIEDLAFLYSDFRILDVLPPPLQDLTSHERSWFHSQCPILQAEIGK